MLFSIKMLIIRWYADTTAWIASRVSHPMIASQEKLSSTTKKLTIQFH
ncbi:hypothetical protein PanWU01x14_200500 [Parasponia andersonii]|uniref:Uncharacterized protein n=1 Tax=Parasponia andersonii TaxID=3476 RepID=A0A2P5BY29_PARAD|nr:hypothetical protein PanWU01x14_200500 [Parasponia andersonii]